MKANWILASIFVISMLFASSAEGGDTRQFDYQSKTPLDFLQFLKESRNRQNTFIARTHVRGWVTEEDIPLLLELLDSEEPCMGVMSEAGSYFPGISTVGDQAAFLVLAYQKHYFPPALIARSLTKVEKQDLRNWWRVYQASTIVNRARGER